MLSCLCRGVGRIFNCLHDGCFEPIEMPVEKPKQKRQRSEAEKAWFRALHIAHYRKGSLKQAAFFYHKITGRWPSEADGLWDLPENGDSAWGAPPSKTYSWLGKK